MRHIGHHRVDPPPLKEGVQLILDILRLLSGEARHDEIAAKTLRRWAMASRAILEFRVDAARRCMGPLGVRGPGWARAISARTDEGPSKQGFTLPASPIGKRPPNAAMNRVHFASRPRLRLHSGSPLIKRDPPYRCAAFPGAHRIAQRTNLCN